MPESTGKTGRGVTFEISDGASPPVWTPIANVTGITPAGRNAEEVDFTHLTSEGGFREYRQGFKDPGTVGLAMHYDPTHASHTDLLTKFVSGALFDWRINYTAAGWDAYETGRGFVQNPGDLDINVDNPIGASATVRVTGPTEIEEV